MQPLGGGAPGSGVERRGEGASLPPRRHPLSTATPAHDLLPPELKTLADLENMRKRRPVKTHLTDFLAVIWYAVVPFLVFYGVLTLYAFRPEYLNVNSGYWWRYSFSKWINILMAALIVVLVLPQFMVVLAAYMYNPLHDRSLKRQLAAAARQEAAVMGGDMGGNPYGTFQEGGDEDENFPLTAGARGTKSSAVFSLEQGSPMHIAMLRKRASVSWLLFGGVAFLMAIVCGAVCGDGLWSKGLNYWYRMKGLQSYVEVKPDDQTGITYRDAGKVTFTFGTKVDSTHAAAYHEGKTTYCVAPILQDVPNGLATNQLTGTGKPLTRDFWAVGTDCCTGTGVNVTYSCGPKDMKSARSGMRVMDEGARRGYHLALEHASTHYNFHTVSPLFFQWTANPVEDEALWYDTAYDQYIWLLIAYAILSLIMSIVAFTLIANHRRSIDQRESSYWKDRTPQLSGGSKLPFGFAPRQHNPVPPPPGGMNIGPGSDAVRVVIQPPAPQGWVGPTMAGGF